MVATAAVFLPSFVMVAGVGWVAPRLRKSVAASAALDGVNAAALALMASVLATLSRAVLGDVMPGVAGTIGVVCLAVLLKTRLNPTWLIGAGAVAGWVLMRVQPGW
jgi:chromate transporter